VLTVGSLFAGIGGFDLGLERAGMRSVWQCEIDPYAQRVLEKHWPDVLRVPDIRHVGARTVPYVDVICGGFPCQDISIAGAGAGIDGERSGLWSEYARVVGELRPRYVVVENVSVLLARGLGRVLGDLAALGYDAEWDCIPASAVGAPHQRDRIWLVAYPNGDDGGPGRAGGPAASGAGQPVAIGSLQDADADSSRLPGPPVPSAAVGVGHFVTKSVSVSPRWTPSQLERPAVVFLDDAAHSGRQGGENLRTAVANRPAPGLRVSGQLNPTWVEWLMGFPSGWTECEPSATPSSRKSPKSSASASLPTKAG
jgi:DNA-cytosine methyltransferase